MLCMQGYSSLTTPTPLSPAPLYKNRCTRQLFPMWSPDSWHLAKEDRSIKAIPWGWGHMKIWMDGGNDCFEGKVHSPLGLVQPYLLTLPGSRLSWESRANMVSAPCLTHALLPPRTPGPYNWKSHQLTSQIQVQRSQFGSSICNVKSKSYSTLCI